MSAQRDIQFITRDKLDVVKWDRCIDHAENALIYPYSYYLDTMAPHWDGLVMNDYEAVMPLTWNKKFGIYYLFQPFLTAELGMFGRNNSAERLNSFFSSIPAKFKYWDISLNHENVFALEDFRIYQRINYLLDLSKPYTSIRQGYRENIIRNIRKAEQSGCVADKNFDVEKVIGLAVEQMKTHSEESKDNVSRFRKLYHHLYEMGNAMTYGVFSAGGHLLSSSVFFYSHRRAYYILVGNHPDGRTMGASHALIDSFIKDHAGKGLSLDFEGSDIPNLAKFYAGFGATEERFGGIRLNRLPFYLKWLKP